MKSDMLENAQDRVEKLEEKVDNTKRENFMLRDEIKDKYPSLPLVSPLSHFNIHPIPSSNPLDTYFL